VAAGSPARAAHGVVDLSWHTCSPVVAHVENPATGPLFLVASVLGNDQTHDAYQVRFVLASPWRTVPDAWRFDAAGCQGSDLLIIHHLAPSNLVKACPSFQGTSPSIQIKDYSFMPPGSGIATTVMRGVMASTYPAGRTSLPSQRYFLAAFIFDHTFSVPGATTPGTNCGGFETPIVGQLLTGIINGVWQTSYLRQSDHMEFPFDPGNTFVSLGGAVPVTGATWGGIKAAYRR
jgi:hypothetical protein